MLFLLKMLYLGAWAEFVDNRFGEIPVVTPPLAVPNEAHRRFMEDNQGAIIHFGMQTMVEKKWRSCGNWKNGPGIDPKTFNPYLLDTDDWVETAVSFGAKYVVMVVDHMDGFSLWPTSAYNYSVAQATDWRGGKGDVVTDFVASAKKFGVRPGFYYSVHQNWYWGLCNFNLTNKTLQPAYEDAAIIQLNEIASRFPPDNTAELWFDGGVGQGLNFIDRINAFVNGSVGVGLPGTSTCHSCDNIVDANQVSWMGNENAVMQYPVWNANDYHWTRAVTNQYGSPNDTRWKPAHCDAVLREHHWFWDANNWNETKNINTPSKMLGKHLTSIGRGCNFVLDMAPTNTGRMDKVDKANYAGFGDGVNTLYGDDIKRGEAGSQVAYEVEILPSDASKGFPNMSRGAFELREDLLQGQTIFSYEIHYMETGGTTWLNITQLQNEPSRTIGNRRIQTWFSPILNAAKFRVVMSTIKLTSGSGPVTTPARLRSAKIFDWSDDGLDDLLVHIKAVK